MIYVVGVETLKILYRQNWLTTCISQPTTQSLWAQARMLGNVQVTFLPPYSMTKQVHNHQALATMSHQLKPSNQSFQTSKIAGVINCKLSTTQGCQPLAKWVINHYLCLLGFISRQLSLTCKSCYQLPSLESGVPSLTGW